MKGWKPTYVVLSSEGNRYRCDHDHGTYGELNACRDYTQAAADELGLRCKVRIANRFDRSVRTPIADFDERLADAPDNDLEARVEQHVNNRITHLAQLLLHALGPGHE